MTSRTRTVIAGLTALVLACLACGCGGGGSGGSEEGIEVALSMANTRSERNRDVPPAEAGQTFYTSENKRIDLENGFINVAVIGLSGCPFAMHEVMRALGQFLVSSAHAHGNAVEAPEGVVDVSSAEGTRFDLGRMPAVPGTYCGVELELAALPHDAPGGDHGALAYLAPCYYPDSGTIPDVPGATMQPDEVNHSCYQIPVAGNSTVLRIGLPAPLALDSNRRYADIAFRVEFDTWFDGVDVPALAEGDAEAVQQLLGNIAASVHIANPHHHD